MGTRKNRQSLRRSKKRGGRKCLTPALMDRSTSYLSSTQGQAHCEQLASKNLMFMDARCCARTDAILGGKKNKSSRRNSRVNKQKRNKRKSQRRNKKQRKN